MIYVLIAVLWIGGLAWTWAILAAGARADEQMRKIMNGLEQAKRGEGIDCDPPDTWDPHGPDCPPCCERLPEGVHCPKHCNPL